MTKKPKVRRKKNARPSRSVPVSFRLDRKLVEQIDGVAERFDVARNNIVALVLHQYIVERGTDEIDRLMTLKGSQDEQVEQLDIFG